MRPTVLTALLPTLLGAPAAAQTFDLGDLQPAVSTLEQVGWSVDVSGEFGVVGANDSSFFAPDPQEGGAWIVGRTGQGTWATVDALKAFEPTLDTWFGYDVAIDGDVAAVGAPRVSTAAADGGAVFLFERQPSGTWEQVARVEAADVVPGLLFGWALDLDGDELIVSTPYFTNPIDGLFSGAAYVFERVAPDQWKQSAQLTLPGPTTIRRAGEDVVLDDGRAVLGAPIPGPGAPSGAVVVYERQSNGSWSAGTVLEPSDGESGDQFGRALAFEGDSLLVGAPFEGPGNALAGAVYLLQREQLGQWGEKQKLTAPSYPDTDRFGDALDLDGDHLAVGAPQTSVGADAAVGAVHVFARDPQSAFEQVAILERPDGAADDEGGRSVAIDGATLFVGVPLSDLGAPDAGLLEVRHVSALAGVPKPQAIGLGTPGCDGPQSAWLSLPPLIDSSAFAITGDAAPPGGLGYLGLGTAATPFGVDVLGLGFLAHIDLNTTAFLLLSTHVADANGEASAPLPLPDVSSLVGATVAAQWIWVWPGCASLPFGLSSSSAVRFTIG